MMQHAYQRLSALFPHGTIQSTAKLMDQGGFQRISARVFLGFVFFFCASMSVVTFFVASAFTRDSLLQMAAALVAGGGLGGVFYWLLLLQAYARAREIESVLPSALQMMSSNIRAGMTTENALWNAARSDFGALGFEIKRMAAHAYGGVPIQRTLEELTHRVRSTRLTRSVKLINEGINLGGKMAPLLDSVASDIRAQQQLEKEIATSTLTYSLFIVFAAIIAAPLLFSVTTYYAQINEKVLAKQGASHSVTVSGASNGLAQLANLASAHKTSLHALDVQTFSYVALAVTAFFAALLLGLLREGKATSGAMWVPVFLVVSLGLYQLALSGLSSLLGTLIR